MVRSFLTTPSTARAHRAARPRAVAPKFSPQTPRARGNRTPVAQHGPEIGGDLGQHPGPSERIIDTPGATHSEIQEQPGRKHPDEPMDRFVVEGLERVVTRHVSQITLAIATERVRLVRDAGLRQVHCPIARVDQTQAEVLLLSVELEAIAVAAKRQEGVAPDQVSKATE